jgi:nicotinamidase-related amidase
MPLTTVDPTPALVVIDLQKGIVSGPVAHVVPPAVAATSAEIIARLDPQV